MRFLPSMTHLTKCPGARHFRTCLGHGVKMQSHLDFESHSLPSICMSGKAETQAHVKKFCKLVPKYKFGQLWPRYLHKVVWPIAALKVTDRPLGWNTKNKSQSCILFAKFLSVFKKYIFFYIYLKTFNYFILKVQHCYCDIHHDVTTHKMTQRLKAWAWT